MMMRNPGPMYQQASQINPMQIVSMIRGGQNPEQLLMSVLEGRAQNNPVMSNIMQLARTGDAAGIEKVARNITKERGLDYDKEFENFKKQMGF